MLKFNLIPAICALWFVQGWDLLSPCSNSLKNQRAINNTEFGHKGSLECDVIMQA